VRVDAVVRLPTRTTTETVPRPGGAKTRRAVVHEEEPATSARGGPPFCPPPVPAAAAASSVAVGMAHPSRGVTEIPPMVTLVAPKEDAKPVPRRRRSVLPDVAA
jgi:hypothetical protein